MNEMNSFSRLIMRLATSIAGRNRVQWTAAMAAETEAAGKGGMNWALGCLWAVLSDRLVRERWFLLGLICMPALAMCLVVPLTLAYAMASRAFGLPILAFVPIALLGPLPCAWLIGRMRPSFPPMPVGTAAFLVHQSVPLIAMWILVGVSPSSFWSPNVTYYNMPAVAGLFASWLVWIGGSWWGGRAERDRLRRSGT